MNENERLAGIICEQLEQGSTLVLASIVSMSGSSPRHCGTKMVVGADGKSYGTIGGSTLEDMTIKESLNVLATAKSKMWHYELNEKDADTPGMICGGEAELLLDCVAPTARNIDFFRCWYEAIQQGNSFYSLTYLKDADDSVAVLGHSILYPDGRVMGDTLMTRTDIERLRPELRNISTTSIIPIRDTRVVIERIHKLKTLYCFGGGHVAVPTAHIAALAGFRVVVVDDRPEFTSTGRFPDAGQIRLIDDFNRALEGLEIDPDSYIVIITRGHQYDRVVLEQALKTDAGYIGMISSRRKREAIFDALMAGGVKKEELERVHSPIGIAIGGETPEEIAVSIVAELIRERSRRPS